MPGIHPQIKQDHRQQTFEERRCLKTVQEPPLSLRRPFSDHHQERCEQDGNDETIEKPQTEVAGAMAATTGRVGNQRVERLKCVQTREDNKLHEKFDMLRLKEKKHGSILTKSEGKVHKSYHLIVIGAGSGGLVAAAGAAGLGAKVALIEKDKMGGDCLNTGCVPSKAIIRTAKLAHDARTAQRFGLDAMEPSVSLAKVMASVREVQAKLEYMDSVERFEKLGVTVHRGSFAFHSPHEISDGERTLSAKRFVIATGSRPTLPPLPGLDQITPLTSDTVWDLEELPRRLVVLGGGPIGTELAQVFARLGSQVTMIQRSEHILHREDPDIARLVQERFRKEGITIHTSWEAKEVRQDSGQGSIVIQNPQQGEQSVAFDQLLVALGRTPNVEGLALGKAGVMYSQRGIQVDDYLRSSRKHIYSCGDVIGSYQFTHTADFQARLILRNALFPGQSKLDQRIIPWCTFSEPEVARVGLNETQAKAQNIPHDVYGYELSGLDRAVCDRESEGLIKVITAKGSDRILGVTLAGSHAGDCLHELVLAMKYKIGLKKIASMIHVYPTLAEVSKRAADSYQRSRLSPQFQRLLRRYFQWRFGT